MTKKKPRQPRRPTKTGDRPGQHTTLDEKKQAQLEKLLSEGQFVETACEIVGVSKAAFYRWMEAGEREDAPAPYRDFRNAIEKARAKAEAEAVRTVRGAQVPWIQTTTVEGTDKEGNPISRTETKTMPGEWQAAAWWLERTFPSRYGKRQTLHHEGDVHIKRVLLGPMPEKGKPPA